jgi:hypothetical protein
MRHDEKRGAGKAATEEADRPVLRTEHPLSPILPQPETEHVQSAESEPIEPGELRQRARMRAAWDLADILGELRVSRRCIADRHMHVDEATIRKMCSGDKPIGVGDLELLPEAVALKLARRIFARRGMKL